MKTFDLKNNEGNIFAFEVVSGVGRVGIKEIISEIPNVKITKSYGYFKSGSDDTRLDFEFNGNEYEIFEPYGDSSRYWVGPKNNIYNSDIIIIKDAFIKKELNPLWVLSS